MGICSGCYPMIVRQTNETLVYQVTPTILMWKLYTIPKTVQLTLCMWPLLNLTILSARVLTYNIHHSRGITTDPLNTVIGRAIMGPSITRAQNTISGAPTTAVIVTTRYRAASTC